MRRAAKTDDNQTEIVNALRRAGCSVTVTSAVGDGFPDIAVGRGQATFLLEIKDGSKPPSARKLTRDQEQWHGSWRGHAAVVHSVNEALQAVGLINAAT